MKCRDGQNSVYRRSSHMYTYGYEARHAERADEAEAPVCSGVGAGADRLMRRSLRYGALPIYLLPRKAPVLLPTTHRYILLKYTATSPLLKVIFNTSSSSFLVQLPTDRPAIRASQPAAPCRQYPKASPTTAGDRRLRAAYIIPVHLICGAPSRDHQTQTCLLSWLVLARACTISPP